MVKKTAKGRITIDSEICKGCYLCISVCPNEVIIVSDHLNQQGYYPVETKKNGNNDKGCIACSMCAIICPDVAIEVYSE
ncbi:ferredoxin family protein [Deltaproteobacteria bacterium]|nr:ferredoxin family protein [Deltaproteobacteria bacterium]